MLILTDGNIRVVGTASDEKGAKSIITTSQLPPMKIKDKKDFEDCQGEEETNDWTSNQKKNQKRRWTNQILPR